MDALMNIVEKVAGKISIQNGKYILLFIMGASGTSKIFFGKAMNKDWPTLPMWFWPVCGTWELVSVGLLMNGNEKIALPLLYIFLGGVYSSVTVMDPKKIPVAVVPTLTTLVVASVGFHQKHSSEFIVPGLGIGFLTGIILSSLGGGKVKSK